MKLRIKQLLAVLLTLALLLPMAALPASAAPAAPLVYVYGEHAVDVRREDGTTFNPREAYSDEIVSGAVSELLPIFARAMVTGDYTEWSEKALELLHPIYEPIQPAPDGTLPENSYVVGKWDGVHLLTDNGPKGRFYYYIWDMRLSPLDYTADLRAYIELVKAQTGASKVVLASRCAGASMMNAYLEEYGYADIEKAIYFCNNLHGFNHADLTLSGKITVNGDAFARWIKSEDKLADFGLGEEVYNFIMSMLEALNHNDSLQDIADTVMQVYDKIKDSFMAPFLREFYGVCAGYVTSVGDNYEAYRDYIFPTDELKAEYANILAKTDAYHYNVQLHAEELMKEMDANGVPVYLLVNWGAQMIPLGEKSSYVSDVDASVSEQSFGATGAKMTQTLSASYIKSREKAGFGKYISPEKQIDASTGLFPDRTFYLKNLRHDYYTISGNLLVQTVANTPDITVDTLPELPQYLTCDPEFKKLLPAQEKNAADIDWKALESQNEPEGVSGFFVNMLAFFAQIFATFRSLFNLIKTLFGVA